MNVFASTVIAAPAEKVWTVVRDFIGLTNWSNVVSAAHITNDRAADQVGAVRQLKIVDGGEFVETLVALSDEDMLLQYDIVDGPIPVTDYIATMRVYPVTANDTAYVTWSAAFDTADDQRDLMRTVVGEQICAGGLEALKGYLES